MGHAGYQPPQKQVLRQRILDTLNHAFPPGSHCACGAEDGRDPTVFLVSSRNRLTKILASWF